MTTRIRIVLNTLAAASAACLFVLTTAPAEAARCPAGYYLCIGGGKVHSPKRCCPVAKPKPAPVGTLTPPRPGARCLSAVRRPGPGGSVKIACVRWGSLTPRALACGA
jgi:hypothetical protein